MGDSPIGEISELIVDCRYDPNIEVWEREVIRDFGSRIQVSLGELTRGYERYKDENPALREHFIEAFARLQGIPASMPTGITLGTRAKERLNALWSIGLTHVEDFVREHKEALKIESWSVGAAVSFPIGISGMLSVTFKE